MATNLIKNGESEVSIDLGCCARYISIILLLYTVQYVIHIFNTFPLLLFRFRGFDGVYSWAPYDDDYTHITPHQFTLYMIAISTV